jgi:4-hydroxy-2-oxoheptanedioate aldolase
VPGIDAVCVGPNDMSGTAGVLRQLDHPTVVAAVDRVYAAARGRKLPVCLGISQPAEAMPALVEAGVRMPIATADLELVAKGAATALAAAKRALGAS